MRKTLLIAAAALAAAVISSQAQVYSLNIVGYVNTVLPAGYSLITCPLVATNASAETQLPCLQTGDSLLTWNGGGYSLATFITAGTWLDGAGNPTTAPNLTLGQGFFYQNGSGSPETNTFVGVVQLTNSIPVVAGYNLIASTAPIAGAAESTNLLGSATSTTLQTGDSLLQWNGGGYTLSTFITLGTWLDGSGNPTAVPNITVGQGFFYQNGQGSTETFNQNVIVQ